MGARAHMFPRLMQILETPALRLHRPARARLTGRGLPGRPRRGAEPHHRDGARRRPAGLAVPAQDARRALSARGIRRHPLHRPTGFRYGRPRMDALRPLRAAVVVCACIGMIAVAVAPALAARTKPSRTAVEPTWHHIAFILQTQEPAEILPSDCVRISFGNDPGNCPDAFFHSPTAWEATPPFRGGKGYARWNTERPIELRIGVSKTTWHVYGTMPSPDSPRFTLKTIDVPWPHASPIEGGDDPSIPAGDKGGPLYIDVDYHGSPRPSYWQFRVWGWVKYADPMAPVLRCPFDHAQTRVGTPERYACQVTGAPAPKVKVSSGDLPAGMSLRVDGSTVFVEGAPAQAKTSTFTLEATNGFDPPSRQTMTIDVARSGVPALLMANFSRAPVYGQPITISNLLTPVSADDPAEERPTGTVRFLDSDALLAERPLTDYGRGGVAGRPRHPAPGRPAFDHRHLAGRRQLPAHERGPVRVRRRQGADHDDGDVLAQPVGRRRHDPPDRARRRSAAGVRHAHRHLPVPVRRAAARRPRRGGRRHRDEPADHAADRRHAPRGRRLQRRRQLRAEHRHARPGPAGVPRADGDDGRVVGRALVVRRIRDVQRDGPPPHHVGSA